MPQHPGALTFREGLSDGIPICLGYISVSFAYGMMATEGGLPAWLSLLISMTNLTSAGQFAGTSLILQEALYIEIAITTFVINIRYMLMSLALTQRLDRRMTLRQKFLLSFGITDEIFAVSIQKTKAINTPYLSGLILLPYCGWALGTFLGATATTLLPLSVRSALGIAIYGMFIAIIIPPAKTSRAVLVTILLASALRCLFTFVPVLNTISDGWAIIICAVTAAVLAALLFPMRPEAAKKEGDTE